jgi:hypothetical protein
VKLVVLQGFFALIVSIIAATFTYYLGKRKGTDERKTAFDQIATQVKLNKTKWKVSYEDATSETSPSLLTATLEFTQTGSRILGEGRDMSGRRWIVEGAAAAERKVCYIYYDPEGQLHSMGAVLLILDNSGKKMTGQWSGWGPGLHELLPRKVTLDRIN